MTDGRATKKRQTFRMQCKGVRTFTLSPRENGSIEFSMEEVFSGVMLPMIAGSLPDFAPSFERYAADLKRAAELLDYAEVEENPKNNRMRAKSS